MQDLETIKENIGGYKTNLKHHFLYCGNMLMSPGCIFIEFNTSYENERVMLLGEAAKSIVSIYAHDDMQALVRLTTHLTPDVSMGVYSQIEKQYQQRAFDFLQRMAESQQDIGNYFFALLPKSI